jgi:hypothetical protein
MAKILLQKIVLSETLDFVTGDWLAAIAPITSI